MTTKHALELYHETDFDLADGHIVSAQSYSVVFEIGEGSGAGADDGLALVTEVYGDDTSDENLQYNRQHTKTTSVTEARAKYREFLRAGYVPVPVYQD